VFAGTRDGEGRMMLERDGGRDAERFQLWIGDRG
jgi:hypothetical protein